MRRRISHRRAFNIINDGNGPLDYTIRKAFTVNGAEFGHWDNIQRFELSSQTGDFQMLGCEFVRDHWYVTGASGPTGTNWIYRFDRDGQFVPPAIAQPSVSAFGWYDLAYDGEYLYGSEDGTGTIVGIDMNGVLRESIPEPAESDARSGLRSGSRSLLDCRLHAESVSD